jgi:hypothetical protein
MKPEDALQHARNEADRKRAEGRYPKAEGQEPKAELAALPDLALLREWAIIEVDTDALVYSTRKGGAPITWFKRMLLRLLRQYTTELEAQQTRFNVAVVAYLESLEKKD